VAAERLLQVTRQVCACLGALRPRRLRCSILRHAAAWTRLRHVLQIRRGALWAIGLPGTAGLPWQRHRHDGINERLLQLRVSVGHGLHELDHVALPQRLVVVLQLRPAGAW